MIKGFADRAAKKKARKFMLDAAKEKGVDLESMLTRNIDIKLDALLQAIIDDIGYIKLAKMGIK